jgi:hypothetical protein
MSMIQEVRSGERWAEGIDIDTLKTREITEARE